MLFRTYATQRDLDAAYDVEASVPDFSIYARLYTEESEDARRRLRHHANVAYGPTLAEYVDIFPAARPRAPVLIFIHGGYWRMLTAKEFSFVAKGFAPYGVTVLVANYALCPGVTVSEISRQMRSLVAWTARNIAAYGGDPGEIAVCGHSAGGHLDGNVRAGRLGGGLRPAARRRALCHPDQRPLRPRADRAHLPPGGRPDRSARHRRGEPAAASPPRPDEDAGDARLRRARRVRPAQRRVPRRLARPRQPCRLPTSRTAATTSPRSPT